MAPFMSNTRPRSIVLRSNRQPRAYRTYEDWQAQQENDTRTAEQRGIRVGSSVMWRHKQDNNIITDRATVVAVADNIVTLKVKDVRERTCSAPISAIVSSDDERLSMRDISRRAYPLSQPETPGAS